jgi:hypothetical protein
MLIPQILCLRYNTRIIANRKLLILSAVMLEARAIAQAFDAGRPSADAPKILSDGELPAELRLIGMRAGRLPREADPTMICGVILGGIAGALDPSLAVGDVVIDAPAGLLAHLPYRQGKIHTSTGIIGTPEEKASLFRDTHALAVDMEAQLVRDWAGRLGVPFIAVRGISDAADHTLDPALYALVDDVGRPKLSALAPALVRPGMIQSLTRIRYNANLAAGAAAMAVRRLAAEARLWRGDA